MHCCIGTFFTAVMENTKKIGLFKHIRSVQFIFLSFLKTFPGRKIYFNTSFRLYLSKTADWQSKARVKINFTIGERFQKHIMNPGRASSIFNLFSFQTQPLTKPVIAVSTINIFHVKTLKTIQRNARQLLAFFSEIHGTWESCDSFACTRQQHTCIHSMYIYT